MNRAEVCGIKHRIERELLHGNCERVFRIRSASGKAVNASREDQLDGCGSGFG